MKLEINLVKVKLPGINYGSLISRSRYNINDAGDIIPSMINFLAENVSTFNAAMTNQRLVSQLGSLKSLTFNELNSLRYLLSVNAGMDIWAWCVSNSEINQGGVDEGTLEYNVLDSTLMTGNLPFTSKINRATDESISSVYQKVIDSYTVFTGELFKGLNNPLQIDVDLMKQSETVIGDVNTTITTRINSTLEFVGKQLKVITY